MFEGLRETISKEMEKGRAQLERLRASAGVLKLELRDKKDAIAEDLQRAFDEAVSAFEGLETATEEKAAALKESAVVKWDVFKAKLKEALE